MLSHDESKEPIFEFEGLMELALEYPDTLFALHLKENSEVLTDKVSQAVGGKKNCFLFLTDFPQESLILKLHKEISKNNLALYVTEKEIDPNLVDKVDYLWLDETRQEIYKDLGYFKKFNKKIICCSPELFLSRMNAKKIASFKKIVKDSNIFGICTDLPREPKK